MVEEEEVWEAPEEDDATSTQTTDATSVESVAIMHTTAAREVVEAAGAGPDLGPAAEIVHTAVAPAPDPALGPGPGIRSI